VLGVLGVFDVLGAFGGGGFKGNLGALDSQAMDVINAFLAVNPVYTLNMDDPKMMLLSKLPLDMKVVEGAIKLVPRL